MSRLAGQTGRTRILRCSSLKPVARSDRRPWRRSSVPASGQPPTTTPHWPKRAYRRCRATSHAGHQRWSLALAGGSGRRPERGDGRREPGQPVYLPSGAPGVTSSLRSPRWASYRGTWKTGGHAGPARLLATGWGGGRKRVIRASGHTIGAVRDERPPPARTAPFGRGRVFHVKPWTGKPLTARAAPGRMGRLWPATLTLADGRRRRAV